jgi:hypothetical protein
MDFSYVDERRFVWARISGPWTIDEICYKPEPILAECLTRKQDLLLIDLVGLASQPITTLDRFRLGSSIISFSGKLQKVACVASTGFIDPEKFGETVARNRGVNIRVFDDMAAAQRWLLEAPDKD